MFKKNLKDLFLFGRILSPALVISGYVFLSVWVCDYLLKNNWPKFIAFLSIPLITVFGLWQGWLFFSKNSKNKK